MMSNLLLLLRIKNLKVHESVEILAENQIMLQCVSVIELSCHGGEGKIKEGIRRTKMRSVNDYHIYYLQPEDFRYQDSCHMSYSIHSAVISSYSCSSLFIDQINHLFRSQVLSPLLLKLSWTQRQSQSSQPQ